MSDHPTNRQFIATRHDLSLGDFALAAAAALAKMNAAMSAIAGTAYWRELQAQAQAERQQMIDALLAGRQVELTAWVDELAQLPDFAAADPDRLEPKTHQRAGITKNKMRGQSRMRRRLAAQSRRRNRRQSV